MTRKLVLVATLCSLASLCTAIDNGLGGTPPMAWRSWNQFGATITQEIIQSQVDAISARNRTVDGKLTSLLEFGYTTVGIDEGWEGCGEGVNGTQHDAQGFPVINKKFPDMKALVQHAQAKGVKMGWYLNGCACGERKAVHANYVGDVAKLHDFGFDAVKLDSCGAQENLTLYAQLMNETGKAYVIENCHQGANPPTRVPGPYSASGFCPFNFWRTSTDISGSWQSIYNNAMTNVENARGTAAGRPGCWAYPDMLEVGGPGLSPEESRTHFGMWVIMSSPLVLGFDLRDQKVLDSVWETITNKEAIAVNHAWHGSAGNLTKSWPVPTGRRPEIKSEVCDGGSNQTGWSFRKNETGRSGQIVFTSHISGAELCVDMRDATGPGNGHYLGLRPCEPGQINQFFIHNLTDAGRKTLVRVVDTRYCLVTWECNLPTVTTWACDSTTSCGNDFTFSADGTLKTPDSTTCSVQGNCTRCMTLGSATCKDCTMNQIWTKPLGEGALAVLVVNGDAHNNQTMTLDFADLPAVAGPQHVRDVWAKSDLGVHAGSVSATLKPHDNMFLVLTTGK